MSRADHQLVLGVSPNYRGFGYVVLEGPTRLVDWQVKRTPAPKNAKAIASLGSVLALYMPAYLVFDAPEDPAVRRSARVTRLLHAIAECAADYGIIPIPVPRRAVMATFAPLEALTRHQIAQALTVQFPELEAYLPPRRRLWTSESPALSVFYAAAQVATFYAHEDTARVLEAAPWRHPR